MMRMVFGLVLLAGLALAGAAVYMAKGYISKTEYALQQELRIKAKTGGLVEVFVVNTQKNYGDPLTKDDVQLMYWPKNSLPEGVFEDPKLLFPDEAKEPRYVLRQMEKYEPILAMKVTEPGEQAGLTGEIAKGMRAFAIKVEAADFLQPSDHVDIYWTGTPAGVEAEITRQIESSLKIIAVDRLEKSRAAEGSIQTRTITVAATQEQVARLAQGQATGRLVISLVGIGDAAQAGQIEVDGNALLGITAQPVVEVAEAPKTCTVRERKGNQMVETAIACTN